MRPTNTDYRSPKTRSGEFVYPRMTHNGHKVFHYRVFPPTLVPKPKLTRDQFSPELNLIEERVDVRDKKHTFGTSRRFQELHVSPSSNLLVDAETDR